MRKLTMMTIMAFIMLGMLPVFAQGLYIGAGIGNSYQNLELQDVGDQAQTIDENSTAYKFFGGFRGESIFGIEGGYRNFGNIESTVADYGVESKTTGWDVEALGRIEIVIVDIFAKAGALFWKTENSVSGIDFTEEKTGTAFMWGLGAGVHLGPLGVRLEYENFQVESTDNLYMLSLSATFGF